MSSSESEPEEVSRTTEFEERLKDIAHAITCLYRFSIAIKNPAPRDRLERCMAIDVSFYTQHDVEHLGYKFPGAPRYLLDRLARANTKRRQLLKYNEKHHTKVVGNTRKSRPDGQPGNQDVDEDVAPPLTADFDDFDHISSSVAYSGAVSSTMETSASTVRQYRDPDISEVRSEGDYSCTSYASSSTNDPEALRVPLPPEPDNAFDEVPFLCPYCFSITAVDGRKSWA